MSDAKMSAPGILARWRWPVPANIYPLLLDEMVTPDWHPLPNQALPVYAYLIRTDAATILVDTGVGEGSDFIDREYQPKHYSLPALLAEHGATLADIDVVVNTHLHFDHSGRNHLFTEVPIRVQAAEREAARAERYTIAEWVESADAACELVDGDLDLTPEVQLILTADHTPGHQVVFVDGAERILIAGQVAESAVEYAESDSAVVQRLRRLEPDRVYFSHGAPEVGPA
jgi:N-acyl homoserine lactone hydrolase